MHQSEAEKAIKSLTVYRDRGLEAIKALDEAIRAIESKNFQSVDGCLGVVEDLLRWRDAAFHNFRALDAIALEKNLDIAEIECSKDLNTQNVAIEMQIESKIRQIAEHRNEFINKVTSTRKAISRYRSGIGDSKKIQANV